MKYYKIYSIYSQKMNHLKKHQKQIHGISLSKTLKFSTALSTQN